MLKSNLTEFIPSRIAYPFSWVGHLPFASWIINEINPKIFVELGTHSGNSYFAFCESVYRNKLFTKCYAVDLWSGDLHSGNYPEFIFKSVNQFNTKRYANFSTLLKSTFDDALKNFPDKSINLLHIDGLHTYQAVKHDFYSWLPKLDNDAIVIFHDIAVQEKGFGVWKFWNELKKIYNNYLEFEHSNGLGIIQLNASNKKLPYKWLSPKSNYQKEIIHYFKKKGDELFNDSSLIKDAYINELKSNILDKDRHITNIEAYTHKIEAYTHKIEAEIHQKNIHIRKLKTNILDKDRHITNIEAYTHKIEAEIHQKNIHIRKLVKSFLTNVFLKLKKAFVIIKDQGFIVFLYKLRKLYTSKIYPNKSNKSKNYNEWLDNNKNYDKQQAGHILKKINTVKKLPLISIIMPVYKVKSNFLIQAIESIRSQSYKNWELCIVDDGSKKKVIIETLNKFSLNDARINVAFSPKNNGISLASNKALKLANGSWVGFMDHDDLLHKDALLYVAHNILSNPDVEIIYSDEDKIDKNNKRYEPHFKSSWNYDLFLSQNYISHLTVIKHDLIKKIKGFSLCFDGSQDYGLLLKCLNYVKGEQIIHIPKILYHWRATEGSTALNPSNKSYTNDAAIKSLINFLKTKKNILKVVTGKFTNSYRVIYDIPKKTPLVTLIIPTKDKVELVHKCISSILSKTKYQNYEILVVNNMSAEIKTLNYLKKISLENKNIRVLNYDYPFNYAAINNFAVKHSKGSIVGLINNDIEVINAEWLTEMVSQASRPEIGCVGAKLYYSNNTIQHAGVILGIGGVAGHSHKNYDRGSNGYFGRLNLVQNLSAVTGACLLVKKKIYQSVGGLDEVNLKVAFNDIDFCLKVKDVGYTNLWTPFAELYHHESLSRGLEDTSEKQIRFKSEVKYMKKKWGDKLLNDQFYNPHLTLEKEDFSYEKF
jgi:O-antigen biosynthesis protein